MCGLSEEELDQWEYEMWKEEQYAQQLMWERMEAEEAYEEYVKEIKRQQFADAMEKLKIEIAGQEDLEIKKEFWLLDEDFDKLGEASW
jgi:hypothetical protein